jgi:putative sterol carrier protein
MHVFPSAEWAAAYKLAIDRSPTYRTAGKDWTHGPLALVVKADPAIGLSEEKGIWLDLHQGVCRAARFVDRAEAQQAPFCITGEYGRWKQVMRKQLDPIQGMMQKKLELKGQMTIIVRFVAAAKSLVEASQDVPTRFLDE